jgi:hypothetical protein
MYSHLLEELSKAIGARLIIRFDYKGKTYVVEPHLLGQNHDMQDCLCAWHSKTDSKLATDGWRCFLLAEIEHLSIQEDRFNRQRPGYDPYDSNMKRIYYRI